MNRSHRGIQAGLVSGFSATYFGTTHSRHTNLLVSHENLHVQEISCERQRHRRAQWATPVRCHAATPPPPRGSSDAGQTWSNPGRPHLPIIGLLVPQMTRGTTTNLFNYWANFKMSCDQIKTTTLTIQFERSGQNVPRRGTSALQFCKPHTQQWRHQNTAGA